MKAVDYQAARESFEQALRYDDSSAAAHLGLGVIFFHLRDDKYAERELTKAAELSPKDATAYQVLGELFYRKDDLETAVSYWEKAVELNPDAAEYPGTARTDPQGAPDREGFQSRCDEPFPGQV